MKRGFPGLLVFAALLAAGGYFGTHIHRAKAQPVLAAEPEAPPQSTDTPQADQMVTVTGPLANYMNRQQHPKAEDAEEESRPSQPSASDHIGPSPQGTSGVVLHKTFTLLASADFPFEIPANAVTPRLHGSYQSYVRRDDAGDQNADVEFLVMNEQQFLDSSNGRPAEAIFSAEASHAQDVNFSLPASRNQPVKYYLVFRSSSAGGAKKTVQADFTVDF